MERLKTKTVKDEKDLSLVERILANENDPKIATILALDLILVGIDTVGLTLIKMLQNLQFSTIRRMRPRDKYMPIVVKIHLYSFTYINP